MIIICIFLTSIMSDHELDAWHDFASEHYEMVEQYPLELHRNFRLLRELDDECAGRSGMSERRL